MIRRKLSLKLALIFILMAASLSIVIALVGNYFYMQKINEIYYSRADDAAAQGPVLIYDEEFQYFRDVVLSKEFREIKEKALQANDETILRDWMQEQKSPWSFHFFGDSLYSCYEHLKSVVHEVQADTDVTYPYMFYKEGNHITYIIDERSGLLGIGDEEEEVPELSSYPGNVETPAVIYEDPHDGWLCTAYSPLRDFDTLEPLGSYGVDIDMNLIIRERRGFLNSSILLILLISFGLSLLSVLILKRRVSDPIRKLAEQSKAFVSGNERPTREDIKTLPIKSENEIGVLYHDFSDMQGRIVDFLQDIERETAEKERLNGQLSMAVRLKLNLIPNVYPVFPEEKRIDLFGDMLPMETVGGDYYDVFRLDENRIAVVIADVFDGGIPSALFMVAFKLVLTQFSGYGLEPSETIYAVNNRLFRDNSDDLTLSCWYGVLDLSTGEVTAVNAGHEPPFIIGKEGVKRIPSDLPVWIVGMMEGMPFTQYEFSLHSGEKLFLYTDGALNAKNESGASFGEERLISSIQGAAGAEEAVRSAEAAINSFSQDTKRTEDTTLLCLEWKGQN